MRIRQIDPEKGALDAYLKKFDTLMKLGRKEDATKVCIDFLSRIGDHPVIYLKLARMFLSEGSYGHAFDYCKRALKLEPNFFQALLTKGNILAQQKLLKEAVKTYSQALKLIGVPDIERATAFTSRGGALIGLRDFKAAIKSLDKAIKLEPRIGHAWAMKGNALLNLGKVEAGMEALKKALELNQELRPMIDEMLRGMNLK